MRKLHEYVFDKVIKSAIIPIVAVEIVLIAVMFFIGFYEVESNKTLVLKRSDESFKVLTEQISKSVEQEFSSLEKETTIVKKIIQTSLNNQNFYSDTNFKVVDSQGFYILDNDRNASVYTTNIDRLSSIDRKNLDQLYFSISAVEALSQEYRNKIDAIWVNLGKYYSLYYPKIQVEEELSSDLDPTQQSYYYEADSEHNPMRKTKFISLFGEPWALELGQIGAVVSPIYQKEQMIGVVGASLSVKNVAKLSAIRLPYNAYVVIADNDGHLLFSSNENQSLKDFRVPSFAGLYKLGKQESLKVFKPNTEENCNYFFHQHPLGDTGLNLIMVTRKSEVTKEMSAIFDNTQKMGVLILLVVVLLHLFFYRRLKRRVATITDDITQPISDIVGASNNLFKEEPFDFQKTDIEELRLLHGNLEKAHDKLINQLYFDTLTGLPNQRKLINDLGDEDVLILISIDNFKNINNVYGPKVGDEVLLSFAKQLTDTYRTDAKVYHIYEDVFALLNPSLSVDKYYHTIQNIRVTQDAIDISLSFSLSSAKNSEGTEFSLFAQAEIALEEARNQDYLNYVVFDPAKHIKEYKNNITWAKKLQDALTNNTLVAFFQPIYDLKQGRVYKFESLVRMMDGDKVISPFFFLGAAARMGKLSDITHIMLKQVLEVASNYPAVEFSINVSFEDFVQADLLPEIKKMLHEHHLSGTNIIFEFLETGTLSDEEKIVHTIEELKSFGCKIAIDDFGAGNSNFSHLMLMQVDYIKIDGQFIKNINTDEKSLNITKTIKAFSDMTGAKTIAEFVCGEDIFDTVNALDIDFAQGYYVSEPKAACEIDAMLAIRR